MSSKIKGGSNTANEANVDDFFQLNAKLGNQLETDGTGDPNKVGSVRLFSENDTGLITGTPSLVSPETDADFRLRIAADTILDYEEFDYTSQNTGKHHYTFTTLNATLTVAGLTTNSSQVNTTTIGHTFGTHAMFPILGNLTTHVETTVMFTTQPPSGYTEDFGLFLRGVNTQFVPLDGVYFRLNNGGLYGVGNFNGVETTVGPFPSADGAGLWAFTANTFYRFLIQVTNNGATFWCNNELLGELLTPVGQNGLCLAASLPWSFRRAHSSTTSDATHRSVYKDYKVGIRGGFFGDSLGEIMGMILGSYQGLSGGTMGQLVAGTVTSGTLVKPGAAVPLNASLAASLPNSLGGRILETLTAGLAVNVDGIFASFTVPAGTTAVMGKRLKVTGLKLSGFVSTVVAGGAACQTEWYIAFGHTSDSLATTETASMATATTKAPRRVMLPELTTTMAITQAAGTLLVQPAYFAEFTEPIWVNQGERLALVGNKTGTVATSGVLSYSYQFIYTWV